MRTVVAKKYIYRLTRQSRSSLRFRVLFGQLGDDRSGVAEKPFGSGFANEGPNLHSDTTATAFARSSLGESAETALFPVFSLSSHVSHQSLLQCMDRPARMWGIIGAATVSFSTETPILCRVLQVTSMAPLKGPWSISMSPPLDDTLEPAHFQAIGRVTVQWSYLESLLQTTIWGLANLESANARALTSTMRMPDLLRTIGVLAHSKLEATSLDGFENILAKIDKAEKFRNRIVHAHWHYNQETKKPEAVQFKYSKRKKGGKRVRVIEEVKLAYRSSREIDKVADEIGDITQELSDFLFRYRIVI